MFAAGGHFPKFLVACLAITGVGLVILLVGFVRRRSQGQYTSMGQGHNQGQTPKVVKAQMVKSMSDWNLYGSKSAKETTPLIHS